MIKRRDFIKGTAAVLGLGFTAPAAILAIEEKKNTAICNPHPINFEIIDYNPKVEIDLEIIYKDISLIKHGSGIYTIQITVEINSNTNKRQK